MNNFKVCSNFANPYNSFLASIRGQNLRDSEVIKESTGLITVLLEVVLHGKEQNGKRGQAMKEVKHKRHNSYLSLVVLQMKIHRNAGTMLVHFTTKQTHTCRSQCNFLKRDLNQQQKAILATAFALMCEQNKHNIVHNHTINTKTLK